jgi:Domain of unknown function (DUF5664)
MKLKKKIKTYLLNNNINSLEQLTDHIEALKASKDLSIDDRDMLFKLVYCVCNKKDCLLSFFGENKTKTVKMLFNDFIKNNCDKSTNTGGIKFEDFGTHSTTNLFTDLKFLEEWGKNMSEQFLSGSREDTHLKGWKTQEEVSNEAIFGLARKLSEQDKLNKNKEALINDNSREKPLSDIIDIIKCKNDDELSKHLTAQIENYNNKNLGKKESLANRLNKDLETVPKLSKEALDRLKAPKLNLDASVGKKESQTKEKAPIFTYCKQMKNAIEQLSLRSLYGHKKYEKGDDWENFARVENGDFEYSNSQFRHALEIGGEETEKEHLIASAWNALARLEIYLRNENK